MALAAAVVSAAEIQPARGDAKAQLGDEPSSLYQPASPHWRASFAKTADHSARSWTAAMESAQSPLSRKSARKRPKPESAC